jgi:hypothetical protein
VAQAVRKLNGEEFERWWPDISKELDTIPHLWEIWWTKEALHDCVLGGSLQCWIAGTDGVAELVVFTMVSAYPSGSILRSILLFGRGIDEYLGVLDATFEDFARQMGAKVIQVEGRPGWEPRLKKLGFGRRQIVMFRDVLETRRH